MTALSPVLDAIRRSALPGVTKWCGYGLHLAPVSEFASSSDKPDGLNHRCRACDAARSATPERRSTLAAYNATDAGRERKRRYRATAGGTAGHRRDKSNARRRNVDAGRCSEAASHGPRVVGRYCLACAARHNCARHVKNLRRATHALEDAGMSIDGRCTICEIGPAEHVDHIVPVSLGGTDGAHNLRWACAGCNLSRGNDTEWTPAETAWRDDEPNGIGSRPVRLGARKP